MALEQDRFKGSNGLGQSPVPEGGSQKLDLFVQERKNQDRIPVVQELPERARRRERAHPQQQHSGGEMKTKEEGPVDHLLSKQHHQRGRHQEVNRRQLIGPALEAR